MAIPGPRPRRVLILGAAGRDFHVFNTVFRDRADAEVVAFTAAQIPDIAGRTYPPVLAGPRYPRGIPIHPEAAMEALIVEHGIDEAVFAYSDVAHADVMHLAARAVARGADFRLLGAESTMLRARCPVISVCGVRTGAGKSPTARRVTALVRAAGLRPVVLRHPMPYGDLARQAVQRFATRADLEAAACTLEEREEYEPHLEDGTVVFTGVDTARVCAAAEAEADVLVWDGGNNDTPFLRSDCEIVVADPHRAGDERGSWPGEVNVRRAHAFVLAKVDTAAPAAVEAVARALAEANPRAPIVRAAMPITVDAPERIRGRRVLVVEDGPTLTHGGMAYGAGVLAARAHGATCVDPRPHAVGSLRATFAAWPHLGALLPAMGYGPAQRADLAATIAATPCDAVLVATPIDLAALIPIARPVARARYRLAEIGHPDLADVCAGAIGRRAV